MAGFLSALSFAAPVGQTLGPAMEQGAREAQVQRSRDAFGKMLRSMGPEYEPFRQWFDAGGQPHEIMAGIGGPIGKRLQEQHDTELTNQILSDPKLTPDQRNQQLFAHNLISPTDYMHSLTGTKATNAFESWAQDVAGYTPDALRALPDKQRQELFTQYRGETAKQQEAPLGGGSLPYKSPGFEQWLSEHPEARMLPTSKAVNAYLAQTKTSPPERQALEQAGIAQQGLDDLLATGKKVLPTTPGLGAGVARGTRAYEAWAGDPNVTAFNASKTVLINHLRAVAGASRVNQNELNIASEAIQEAGTYPALEKAVGEAKKRLAEAKKEIEAHTTQYGETTGDSLPTSIIDGSDNSSGSSEANDFVDEHFGEGESP